MTIPQFETQSVLNNFPVPAGAYIKGRPGRPWKPLMSDCKWCLTVNAHEICHKYGNEEEKLGIKQSKVTKSDQ